MRIERRDGYRLWVGGPVPPGAAGITLGRMVIVRRHALGDRLLRHELVHVRQFSERGRLRFLVSYVAHYVRWRFRGYSHRGAYRRIPQEIEAYWLERFGSHDPADQTSGQMSREMSSEMSSEMSRAWR